MSVPISELGKYQKYGRMGLALFLVLAPLSIYACFEVFRAVAGGYLPAMTQPVVAVRAGDGFWFATALLPGMVLACCLIALILRLILGAERSAEYRMLSNRRKGVDATKGAIALGILTVAGSLAMAYFGLHAGLYLGHDELVIHRMWSLQEERYRYEQVRALREVRNPDRENPVFVIQVAGAPDWTTEQEVSFPDAGQKALLVRRTGRAILRGAGE